MFDSLLVIILFLLLMFIYFLPTIIAYSRNHTNVLAIFVLNLFLGATFVVWVFALIWAVYKKDVVKIKKVK